ncbi:uncharacterized protein LOC133036160 [Cannabis sativa]|uniref:uncharacterized protein LOC133036160 n=1 Tax=Cannabis sativa TaxID=3483 RepID=UPI0029C9B34F|nr:uncharacterized protein LOC133036160 [Cannabis sativa]
MEPSGKVWATVLNCGPYFALQLKTVGNRAKKLKPSCLSPKHSDIKPSLFSISLFLDLTFSLPRASISLDLTLSLPRSLSRSHPLGSLSHQRRTSATTGNAHRPYSVEEAKKKIYNVSCEIYFGFGYDINEENSNKPEGLQGVLFVLPDSYVDPKNKDYGGITYISNYLHLEKIKMGSTEANFEDFFFCVEKKQVRNPFVPVGKVSNHPLLPSPIFIFYCFNIKV